MFGARLRGLLSIAAVSISMLTAANSATIGPFELHREAVDEQRYPWSSVGKGNVPINVEVGEQALPALSR